MNDVLEMLVALGEFIAEFADVVRVETLRLSRIVLRRLQTAARLAIVWPFLLLFASMLGYDIAKYAVPIVTTFVLLVFLWMLTRLEPLAVLTAQVAISPETPLLGKFVEKAREATKALRVVVGLELLTGIYFSVVPIANDRRLALVLTLVVAAIVCFVGISKKVVWGLVLGAILITVVFYCGGWDSFIKVFAASQQPDEGHQKPAAGQPAPVIRIPEPVAGARPNGTTPAVAPLPVSTGRQCRTFSSDGPPTFQYADFTMMMLQCDRFTGQVRFSGMIQYHGREKFILYFHEFIVRDNRGNLYKVQTGQLDGSDGLGTGKISMWVSPGDTIAFSFVVGSPDGSPISTAFMDVVMPYNQRMGGEIAFRYLILN